MKKSQGDPSGGAGQGSVHAPGQVEQVGKAGRIRKGGKGAEVELDPRAHLVEALRRVGLEEGAAVQFGDAALVMGALSQGRRVRDLELGSVGASARAAEEAGTRPKDGAAPGSMEEGLHEGDVALGAVEALAACAARLEAAMVVAVGEQVSAVGAALLAQRDVSDPGELSKTARERWRARAKSRVRAELAPAIGWTPGECAHLVAVACAPLAFSTPVVTQMARGVLPWRLARSLWRACETMDARDAAHVATVLCADDPASCVPERLAPDGSIEGGPWQHRAFYAALAREVAKITQADDADPEKARLEKARREAAWAGRGVWASVDEDGTGKLTVVTSAFWVAAIKDRLNKAARAARGAGDGRTLDQLESDIARILLAHATVGFADQPGPTATDSGRNDSAQSGPDGGGSDPGGEGDGRGWGVDDLTRAGWSPELVQALSALPAAVLQVIVPLMGLHDPAAAQTLPGVGRAATRPGPNTPASGPEAADDDLGQPGQPSHPGHTGHTGRPGCPACLPSVRTGHGAGQEEDSAWSRPGSEVPGADCAHGRGPAAGAPSEVPGADCAHGRGPETGAPRRLWLGEVLGNFSMFVSPAGVRALALAPGTTLSRLLVDPADGRCVERSIATYRPDAAMRAQILAADVTCRAPACQHTGSSCQVDHVLEYGTPGGVTSESNGQLVHTTHHEAKTAKDWDADLSANRDVEWTTLLGRIYRTRAWDYRRYVTLVVDAIDAVRSAPVQDQALELDRQVYLALAHRDLEEQLNVGDDDLDPAIARFEGWPYIGMTHRDRHTGARASGPSADAVAHAHAARATSGPPSDPGTQTPEPEPGRPDSTTAQDGPAAEEQDAQERDGRSRDELARRKPSWHARQTRSTGATERATTGARSGGTSGRADGQAGPTCTEPCCLALREVAGRRSGKSPKITRLDGRTGKPVTDEEYRELRKAWTLANHEGILPF